MRLLVVDYISIKGHQNFNKIHIESLLRLGHSLHLVGRKGQFDNLEQRSLVEVTYIPEWMFKQHAFGQLTERINGVVRLLWLRNKIKPKRYDATIFLIYDILSFFFYRDKSKTYLVNHNNVSQLSSKVKYWMTRHLPAHYAHIALNEDMEMRLKQLLPNREVWMVPHGICPASSIIKRPSFLSEGRRFIFCPVNRNYNDVFVRTVFSSKAFKEFLSENSIDLYVKNSMPVEADEHIIKIDDRIDIGVYNFLLKESVAVILPYDSQFKYRSSGILFESVAYNRPIIANDIEAMAIYQDKIEMRLFRDEESFVECIGYYLKNTQIKNNIELFTPDSYWEKAL